MLNNNNFVRNMQNKNFTVFWNHKIRFGLWNRKPGKVDFKNKLSHSNLFVGFNLT